MNLGIFKPRHFLTKAFLNLGIIATRHFRTRHFATRHYRSRHFETDPSLGPPEMTLSDSNERVAKGKEEQRS